MLIEPRPSALLRRACEAIEASTGDTRQQRAALWLLRELAKSIDGRHAAIAADAADMCAVLGEAVPATNDAGSLHVQLQARLQEMAADRSQHPRLRALQLKLLRRERELLGPPGGNPSLDPPPTPTATPTAV